MWFAQLSCYLIDQFLFVNSAAMCQLSCTLLAQLKAVNSAAKSAATFAEIAAELHPVSSDISAATCCLSCSLSTRLHSVRSNVFCQLGCDMSSHMLAQLPSLSSPPLVHWLSAPFILSRLPKCNCPTKCQSLFCMTSKHA